MPLIDLKSDLSAQVTRVLNETERRAEDSSRLLKFLASGKGALFAAKQGMLSADIRNGELNPTAAAKRLGSIIAQIGLNMEPFGIGTHIGLNPNGPGLSNAVEGTAAENSRIRDRASQYRELAAPTAKDWTPYSNPGFIDDVPFGDLASYYYRKDVSTSLEDSVFIGEEEDVFDMDVVPFYFTTYKLSDGVVRPGKSLAFRSFFSNIQDTVTGNWSPFTYVGRGEQFYVYNNRSRSMGFSFKVAAFNKKQLYTMHEKVNVLKSFLAPTYSQLKDNGDGSFSGGYMQGNFYKLTIGNYVKDLPGIITNVSVTVAKDYVWEIVDRTEILPHVMDISVQFTVLENVTPQARLS